MEEQGVSASLGPGSPPVRRVANESRWSNFGANAPADILERGISAILSRNSPLTVRMVT